MEKFIKINTLINGIIIILVLLSVGSLAADPRRMMKGGDLDIDKLMKESSDCFWHVMCDLKLPLEFKKTVDVLLRETIGYAIKLLYPMAPQNVRDIGTYENVKKDEIWVDILQPATCNLTEDERERMMVLFSEEATLYITKICYDENKKVECDSFAECQHVYNEMITSMTEKGECYSKAKDSPI